MDHAGNLARFGRPEDFELPPLDDSSLDDRAKKARNIESPDLAPCPDRFDMMAKLVFECPSCGYSRKRPVNIEVVDGALVDLDTKDGKALKSEHEAAQDTKRFYHDLIAIGEEKGYKSGWAAHQYKSRHGQWPKHRPPTKCVEPLEINGRWIRNQNTRRMIALRKKRAG